MCKQVNRIFNCNKNDARNGIKCWRTCGRTASLGNKQMRAKHSCNATRICREWWLRTRHLKRKYRHTWQQQRCIYVNKQHQHKHAQILLHTITNFAFFFLIMYWSQDCWKWSKWNSTNFHLHLQNPYCFSAPYMANAFIQLKPQRESRQTLKSVQSYSEAAVGWVIRWALGLRVNRAHLQTGCRLTKQPWPKEPNRLTEIKADNYQL